MPRHLVHVVVEDPDLITGVEGERLQRAERDLIAEVAMAFKGPWEPEVDARGVRGGFGLLLLRGLIVRRVGRTGRFGAELLGPGDLIRPWEHDGEDVALPFEVRFDVLERATFALLDLRFAARVAAYPEVASALMGRAMQRSRTLAVNMAIAHYPRTDRRLLLLLWHLADRWGKVTSDGVLLPLPLTHQLLADLVAARRPSVTEGLQRLRRERLVTKAAGGWLLYEEPPDELEQERWLEERRAR
jgi:hypothetical protein